MRHDRMQGRRIHRSDPPRQFELGTGRQLSAREMARERAAGVAAHSARGQRHQRAIVRLLTYAARRCLPSSPASPFPPTCADMLYLRLHALLRHSTCLRRRGSQFWEKKWELERDIANAVWREHVDGLRQQLARA